MILQGVELSIFLLFFEWALKQCSATALPVICVFFWFNSYYFVLVLFAFVALGLISLKLCQEIFCEERLRNDLFCVDWDVKPQPDQWLCVLGRYDAAAQRRRGGRS